MKYDEKEIEQMMAKASEYFKDKKVVEASVLVGKNTLEAIENTVKNTNVTALIFSMPIGDKQVAMLKNVNADVNDFLYLKIIVEQKNAKKLFEAISSGTEFSTYKTAQAKMMEAFLDDDSRDNPQ